MTVATLIRTALIAAALAMPIVGHADAVSDWAEFAGAVEDAGRVPDAPFDVDQRLAGTRTLLAMFEAADAVDRRYVSFLNVPRAAPGASGAMAVATAAHDVLAAAFPGQKAAIDDRLALALAEATAGRATDDGIAAGHAAAKAALAAGGLDPTVALVPYFPAGRPGQWLSTSGTVFDPHWLAVRPWLMASTSTFRPGPPVALDSVRWAKDVDEVRRMGGKASASGRRRRPCWHVSGRGTTTSPRCAPSPPSPAAAWSVTPALCTGRRGQ